jgi:hypothetical protein
MLPIQMNNGPSTPAPAQNPHQEVVSFPLQIILAATINNPNFPLSLPDWHVPRP